mmetsp:Transcript_78759/g.109105  ORF Transcript_78759/g.109105 Transcript_78759/m.109105 type:complete len:125 (+) Transcript_78759:154-528(+)
MAFEWYYNLFYFVFLFSVTIAKGISGLLYPPSIWELELAGICLFFIMQLQRLDLGYRANRTEHPTAMNFFAWFSLFSCIIYSYLAWFTTYVLLIDIVVGSIGIFFTLCEFVFGLMASSSFKKAS